MPSWNSLQAVQSIHTGLEFMALVFFAGLIVFEVLARSWPKNKSCLENIGYFCFAFAILLEGGGLLYGTRSDKLANQRIAHLVELESKLAWRSISKDSQSAVASRLVRFSGQTAQISYSAGDLEAESFALDISSVLRAAKWKEFGPQGIGNMRQVLFYLGTNNVLGSGVTVQSTTDRASRNAAVAVVHELSNLGFNATLSPTIFPRPTSVVFIFVAHRPQGAQGKFKLGEQKRPKQ